MSPSRLPSTTPLVLNSPLWKRAPVRDENGKPFSDFMMLIPGLNKEGEIRVEVFLQKIQNCLKDFESEIVYVDLNIRLSILWISLKPIPGKSGQIARAVQQAIPHAKLVTSNVDSGTHQSDRISVRKWGMKLLRPVMEKWAQLENKSNT